MITRLAALLAVCGLSTGCGLLYTNIRAPHAYRSATPADVKAAASDETVSGQACNYAVLFLVSWGKGGYTEAVRKALEGRSESILYDVKTDLRVTTVLVGIYTRTCTVVTGKVGKL